MKKLFRLSKAPVQKDSADSSLITSIGVHPKLNFELPAVPHPTPYYRIAILASADALLLRPAISGVSQPHSFVRIPWGDSVRPEEVSYGTDSGDARADWSEAAVVYGILGCLQLTAGALSFSFLCYWSLNSIPLQGAHILVITSKHDAGHRAFSNRVPRSFTFRYPQPQCSTHATRFSVSNLWHRSL